MREDPHENKQTNKQTKYGAPRLREFQLSRKSTARTPWASPLSKKGLRPSPSPSALANQPPSTAAGNGAEAPPGYSPFPRREPQSVHARPEPSRTRSLQPPEPKRLWAWSLGRAEETGLRKGRKKKSGPMRAEEPHLAPGKHRPYTAVHGPLKGSSGETSSGETQVRPVHPKDGGQRLSFAGALVPLELPAPPALSLSPRVPARTDRGLTIAVEELQPVVNPVIGLFAVGFLGCIRTQRHKRRRREVGVSSWTDFEATFPSGPLAGEPDRPGNSRNCGQLVIPLPPPIPTLTVPSSLPENSVGRSQAIPIPWGLGPGPAEAGAARGPAVEGGFIPGALDSGV